MAFNQSYLGRISSTANSRADTWWSYTHLSDTMAAIRASGYFNNAVIDLTGNSEKLKVGSVIAIRSSDGNDLIVVLSVTTNVTTGEYNSTVFEDWQEKTWDTDYVAPVDGIVVAYMEATSDMNGGILELRSQDVRHAVISAQHDATKGIHMWYNSASIPVKKGQIWRVNKVALAGYTTPNVTSVYFRPMALV